MSDIIKGKFNLSEGAMMERIRVENSQVNLVDIVKRVESGEEFIFTQAGEPVAKLVPIKNQPDPKVKHAIDEIKRLRKGFTLGDITIKEMIEEGRA